MGHRFIIFSKIGSEVQATLNIFHDRTVFHACHGNYRNHTERYLGGLLLFKKTRSGQDIQLYKGNLTFSNKMISKIQKIPVEIRNA